MLVIFPCIILRLRATLDRHCPHQCEKNFRPSVGRGRRCDLGGALGPGGDSGSSDFPWSRFVLVETRRTPEQVVQYAQVPQHADWDTGIGNAFVDQA